MIGPRACTLGGALVAGMAIALAAGTVGIVLLGILSGAGASPAAPPPAGLLAAEIELSILIRTVAVAAAVATIATVLAIPAAWSLRRLGAEWGALLLAPMLLPAYLVHAASNILRGPGTWLGDLLEGGTSAFWAAFGTTQAVVSLALWSWPIAAAILSISTSRIGRESIDAIVLAGGPWWRRAASVALMMRGGVLGAWLLIGVITLGSAVPLHLAQVETYSIVVWRELSDSGLGGPAWRAAIPLLMSTAGLGAVLGLRLLSASRREGGTHEQRDSRVHPAWLVTAGAIWMVSAVAPLALFLGSMSGSAELVKFWPLAGRSLAVSAGVASIVGTAVGLIAVGVGLGAGSARLLFQRAAGAAALALIALALVPGVLTGAAIAVVGSTAVGRLLTDSWAGVIVAHVGRFGAIGALTGWWIARSEPESLRDARFLIGSCDLSVWARSVGRIHCAPLAACVLASALLSLHEIEATVMAAPAGTPSFAQHMLGLLHYLRDDQLAAGVVVVGGSGLAAAVATGWLWGFGRGAVRCVTFAGSLLALLVLQVGCEGRMAAELPPVVPRSQFGSLGRGDGQFVYPRAMDSDGESLFVADKTGRVQRLGLDGAPRGGWVMPAFSKGFATGLTCGPDGMVYVADTHEHRVLVFRPEGTGATLVGEWGGYGPEGGHFVFPTDVAIIPGPDGRTPERIYVSEYGGGERVSAFDAQHRFLFSFGSPGMSGPGEPVRFSRPQSIAFDPGRRRLIVADAANHRLGLFSLEGELLGWIGSTDGMPGREPGRFSYPYGLSFLGDGTVLVAEFGNCRVQRIDLDSGQCLGLAGRPGRDDGELVTPWAVAAAHDRVFLLDSGNARIIELEPPSTLGGG